MPENGKMITFTNWQKTQLNPFVVYADLEAIDVASNGSGNSNCNTTEIERQYPASFGAVLVDSNCKYSTKEFFAQTIHSLQSFNVFQRVKF